MALAASPVPSSIQDAKSLPFHENESDLWNSYEEKNSSRNHDRAEDGELNLASMLQTTTDHHQQQDKHYPASTTGLSRNASFDSVASQDSCTASFSTGSPVTVLPTLTYTAGCVSGPGMDISPSTHNAAAAAGWNINSNKRSVTSSGLEVPEQQQSQESMFINFSFHEPALLSDDCEQLLASPVGSLPSMLEFPPFSRFDDQPCASTCNDFSPVSELDCLLPTSHRTSDSTHRQQAVKSPESVGNVHSPSKVLQQQQDFCQEFLVGEREVYPEQNARRSDSALLLSAPSARRRLSWSEYQVFEPQGLPSTTNALHHGFSSHAYDHHHSSQLPSVVPWVDNKIGSVSMNPVDPGSSCTSVLVGDTARVSGSSSLKRPYSTMMMMQQPVPSTCSISSSAPAPSFSTTSNEYLNLAGHLPVPTVPKSVSNSIAPILPPMTNLSTHSGSSNKQQQQDVAAFNALLYKTQGNSTSEMMQQLQQQQGTSSCDSAARPLPPPKLRRRHGTATDPQSIAARTRRERFSDRIRILQSLVPNGERLDTVSMLGHTLEYVRFLQHQVWTLYNGNDDAAASADSESREKWKEFMEAQTVVA